MRRFLPAKGVIGVVLVGAVVFAATLAPVRIPPEFATRMDMRARLAPPSLAHPFGTDHFRRDLMYRVLLGAQTSFGIAAPAVGISPLLGLPLGLVSDYLLMRLVDALLSFPALLLALAISAVLHPRAKK